MVCPKNLWCFDWFLLFAPWRHGVKNSSLPCIAKVSRKAAKPLRSRDETGLSDSNAFFAPWRLSVKTSSLPCIAEVSRKDAEPLRLKIKAAFLKLGDLILLS